MPGSSGSRRGESRSSRGAAAGGRTCAAMCLTSRSQSPMSSLQPLPPSRHSILCDFLPRFVRAVRMKGFLAYRKPFSVFSSYFFSILLTKSPFKSISYQVFLCCFFLIHIISLQPKSFSWLFVLIQLRLTQRPPNLLFLLQNVFSELQHSKVFTACTRANFSLKSLSDLNSYKCLGLCFVKKLISLPSPSKIHCEEQMYSE